MITTSWTSRRGQWALIAGASEGLGAAFARSLARRGMNIILVARRLAQMKQLADECASEFRVETRCVEADLGASDFMDALRDIISDNVPELLVYNAAYAPVGEFKDIGLSDLNRVLDVNARGPLTLIHELLPHMIQRKRGAIVLMSSLAGNQGTPNVATYAASKAFNTILAEALWHELKPHGIQVIACCAGAIRTPGYAGAATSDAPGTLNPEEVAEQTLNALGKGPRAIPGVLNRFASFLMGRLFPRSLAIRIMAASTRKLSHPERNVRT